MLANIHALSSQDAHPPRLPFVGLPKEPLPPTPGLRLALSARAMARMLDIVDYGLLLLADDDRVTYANEIARFELAGSHPLVLNGNQLSVRSPVDAAALRRALHAATRRSAQSLLTLDDPAGGAVAVSVVPLAEPGEMSTTLLVLGKRQVCEELSCDAFARQHALTLAETRVLKRLCGGDKPSAIAHGQGVKLSTVRTQISSIRMKTGARGVGQLVQQVSRLPPLPCLLRAAA